ncbi:hypothetical protein DVH24_020010 [Malus domestica]|uniref:Uncharacterized protein n=1 Tax=Malus domestica TaxID=3750 RepID=A0A498I4J8_MALDO|nr:hypothetical protein DVH24_020010 [Malus domestica]
MSKLVRTTPHATSRCLYTTQDTRRETLRACLIRSPSHWRCQPEEEVCHGGLPLAFPA